MTQFLQRILYFALGLIVANVVVVCIGGLVIPKSRLMYLMHYNRGSNSYTRLVEAKKAKDVDILFVGTSQCFRGFDTRIFEDAGYHTFNMGSTIQTALQTEMLLERYIDSIRPKRIIFEVNPRIFDSDGVESAGDLISNDKAQWGTVEMAIKVNNYKIYNTLIFSQFRQMIGEERGFRPVTEVGTDRYVAGGFVETSLSENGMAWRKIPPFTFQFRRQQLNAFSNVIDIMRKRKIPYALVQTPVTKAWYAARTNNKTVDSLMMANGRYYDFNKLIELDNTKDFYDENHLTQRGVEKFNRKMIDILRKDGFLP